MSDKRRLYSLLNEMQRTYHFLTCVFHAALAVLNPFFFAKQELFACFFLCRLFLQVTSGARKGIAELHAYFADQL